MSSENKKKTSGDCATDDNETNDDNHANVKQ